MTILLFGFIWIQLHEFDILTVHHSHVIVVNRHIRTICVILFGIIYNYSYNRTHIWKVYSNTTFYIFDLFVLIVTVWLCIGKFDRIAYIGLVAKPFTIIPIIFISIYSLGLFTFVWNIGGRIWDRGITVYHHRIWSVSTHKSNTFQTFIL